MKTKQETGIIKKITSKITCYIFLINKNELKKLFLKEKKNKIFKQQTKLQKSENIQYVQKKS